MPETISSLLITWPGGVVTPPGSFPGNDIMIHSQTIFLYNRTKEFIRIPRIRQDFVSQWKRVSAREKQTYEEHFVDLCHLVGTRRPAKELIEQSDRWLNAALPKIRARQICGRLGGAKTHSPTTAQRPCGKQSPRSTRNWNDAASVFEI